MGLHGQPGERELLPMWRSTVVVVDCGLRSGLRPRPALLSQQPCYGRSCKEG